MTFQAYYPATEGTSMTAFNLPADQSSTEKIALADCMTRQQTCNNESGTDINLNLKRKTARVIVRIAGFIDQYFDDQKTVRNVRIYSEASGIEDGNPTGSSTEILPYAQGNGGQGSTYTALVVPGWGDSGANFISLTDGENNTLLVKGIPEMQAGYSYTFNLTVGKYTIQVQSVTVTDWATGTTLAGGQAEEQSGAADVGHALSASAVGEIVGSDGKVYSVADKDNLPSGVTAAGMVAYKNGSNGLVIALADEASTMNRSTANGEIGTAAHTPTVTGYSWRLPSMDEWNLMFNANGGNPGTTIWGGVELPTNTYTGLNTALATAGGDSSKLREGNDVYYWSSTLSNQPGCCWDVNPRDGTAMWMDDSPVTYDDYVRACFNF